MYPVPPWICTASDAAHTASGSMMAKPKAKTNDTGANLGFEAKLWAAADALRNNMDAAEYKHVVLGLIFLKFASDKFEERRKELVAEGKEKWVLYVALTTAVIAVLAAITGLLTSQPVLPTSISSWANIEFPDRNAMKKKTKAII